MKVLWICPFPGSLAQDRIAPHLLKFFRHPAPWIEAHLPPCGDLDLHIASLCPGGASEQEFEFLKARWHLIPVPVSGRSLKFFANDFKYFEKLFRELSPEVVHAWGTEDSNSLVAVKLMPHRTLIGIQGLIHKYMWVSGLKGLFRRMICSITECIALSKSRYIVAESDYSLKCAAGIARKAHGYVVQHPIRSEIFMSSVATSRAPIALFVGELSVRKGISEAITAFASTSTSDWRMRIIGDGDPNFVKSLKQLAKKLNVGDRILFLGNLTAPEVIKEMNLASIFLLPTKMDTGPTSLKEALCMGLWPVCFDNSGPAEYIRKFQWGSLAENLNQQDLQIKLRAAIQSKPWLEIDRFQKLIVEVRSFFSSEAAWSGLIPIYKHIRDSN